MSLVQLQSRAVEGTFSLEACPFETVMVDVTHRCNMACHNCYIPNRMIPDLDAAWLDEVFRRLPRGRFLRLAGAEPTMRSDLPELIRSARRHGHHPILLTNGLKLADRAYVRALKEAGLQIAYLSFNGGYDDDLYEAIDRMRCAGPKAAALDNLAAEHVYTSVGMILTRGVNEGEVPRVLGALRSRRSVRELKLRSIGKMGRYMENPPFSLHELLEIFCAAAGLDPASVERRERTATSHDFAFERLRVQLTVWPDLNSPARGRVTPEGTVAPFMEHVIANDGGY